MTDDPNLRKLLSYSLRTGVAYQDGRMTDAPHLVFADADYEVGDGTCGLHSDGKQANEPAIVYVRADNLMHAEATVKDLRAQLATARADALREAGDFVTEWLDNVEVLDPVNRELLVSDILALIDKETDAREAT